jgi:hypothetical protein
LIIVSHVSNAELAAHHFSLLILEYYFFFHQQHLRVLYVLQVSILIKRIVNLSGKTSLDSQTKLLRKLKHFFTKFQLGC